VVHVEALRFEQQLDRLRRGAIVFDQQYAHAKLPSSPRGSSRHAAMDVSESAFEQAETR
jgi:hypothetical protein